MDFEEMRKLEREMDAMQDSSDPEVIAYLKEARDAKGRNDHERMEEKIRKAQDVFVPPLKLGQALIDGGFAPNMARARRLCSSGSVFVDGRRTYKHDTNVARFKQIRVGGKTMKS
jgi:ribosomal protein S4